MNLWEFALDFNRDMLLVKEWLQLGEAILKQFL